MSKRGLVGIAALLLLGLGLGGCHLRPLLYNVSVTPEIISPNADGSDDATNIEYELSRNAQISIYFENAEGERFYFRQQRPRSAGEYRVQWGGDGQPVLPAGERVWPASGRELGVA